MGNLRRVKKQLMQNRGIKTQRVTTGKWQSGHRWTKTISTICKRLLRVQ